MAQANVKAVITAEDRASRTISGVGASFGKLSASFAVGQLAANAASKAFNFLTDTIKSSVGAAFEQVRSVENATFALKAYEKNGSKVNRVLGDLIKFARSDLGVLFQREDLFKAASNLKAFGVTTDSLVDKIKILSRGVALGYTNFDEFSTIVGRVISDGRLMLNDWQLLAERGIILNKSMVGTTISAEELFVALEKALPAELLKGRANTIDGAFIQLKSSLRDIGSAILGVDAETSKFIEGGLGDRFMQWVREVTERLKDPAFKKQVQEWIRKINEFIQNTDWKAIASALAAIAKAILFIGQQIGGAIANVKRWQDRFIAAGGAILFHLQRIPHNARIVFSALYDYLTSPIRRAAAFIINSIGRINNAISGVLSLSPAGLAIKGLKNILPGFQTGTSFAPGGMAVVGEQGPELVNLPRGSKVIPNNSSRGGNSSNININITVPMMTGSANERRKVARMLIKDMQDLAAMNGKSVTSMLGSNYGLVT